MPAPPPFCGNPPWPPCPPPPPDPAAKINHLHYIATVADWWESLSPEHKAMVKEHWRPVSGDTPQE